MATTPAVFEEFGGLNLADPQQIGTGEACDLLNVEPEGDRLRTRAGYSTFFTLPSSDTANALAEYPKSGGSQLLVAGNAKVYAYDNTGVVITSTASNTVSSIAVVGTPTATAAYLSDTASGIRKWNGAAFSLPVTAINPQFLTVQTLENRLVAGKIGSTSSPSRVHFSDPGAPETFGANNYIDLSPGDGESIAGLVTWQDQVFAFKRTKFFVFYGNSTDGDGEPVFNYRSVDGGVGVGASTDDGAISFNQVCAGRTGVYFIADDGIYRTVGGMPERVSRPLDYWFWRRTLPSCPTLTGLWDGDLTGASLVAFQDRVYCTFKAAGSPTTFVLNETTGAWTVYRFANFGSPIRVLCGTSFDDDLAHYPTALKTMVIGFSNSVVGKHDASRTTDNGGDISWSWSSGFDSFGSPSQVKVTLESRVWGSGTVTLKVGTDYGAFDTGSALTLGTAPAVTDAWQQIDREGTLWQHKVSGTGPAIVSRVAHYVSFTKPSGVQ